MKRPRGPSRDPFVVGDRTRILGTCSRCGHLFQGKAFGLVSRRPWCHLCEDRRKDKYRRHLGVYPGARTVLAKSCHDCGVLKLPGAYLSVPYRGGRCLLDVCLTCAPRDRTAAARRGELRARQQQNDLARDSAGMHGQQWTGAHMEWLALHPQASAVEAAAALGRTVEAVRSMRKRLQIDPRYIKAAGAPRA